MTRDELSALQQKMAEVEKEVLEDIRAKAQLLGFELIKNGENKPARKAKTGVKYRGPEGQEWSGRGKKPAWLVQALEDGKSLEDLAA